MSRPAVLVAIAALAAVLIGVIVMAQDADRNTTGVGGGTQVEAPGTRVDSDARGTRIDAPGTSVDTNESGTRVQAPGVDITIPNRDRE